MTLSRNATGVRKAIPRLVGMAAAIQLLAIAPASGQASRTVVEVVVPFHQTVPVPCANGGNGEQVVLIGDQVVEIRTTVDAAGGTHTVVHSMPLRIWATGSTTGDVYQATIVGTLVVNRSSEGAETTTLISNFLLIGRGPRNNVVAHGVFHQTFLPDGTPAGQVDVDVSFCR